MIDDYLDTKNIVEGMAIDDQRRKKKLLRSARILYSLRMKETYWHMKTRKDLKGTKNKNGFIM